ncbi:uncharacterized protein LOC105787663 [Gossypium raimondii]|uniref:Uncharacterized protein n=2 Tax=Gossypium raimondii TaxID=29730 RepID=A0A0D2QKF7_GOSRA|nr:uncharacterized protein LOC105787663 [Gossypium raimondii]KJB17370.1 hypothetical protein B456_003G028900 [Gossypium raimondii]KJB17371.1 hypothetical protein B456_003G028900 [Gossypium raimondii]KJB17373.1 hypothetical protein B456_003G028900 [Gossypium raimondii]
MEKLLRPYDKEFMRMAMLKHEETFKEQVYELHRLYRIQKTLMKSIGTSRAAINGSFHHGNINSRTRFDLEHPADADADADDDDDAEFIDESEIELTLGPTKYMSRKKHGTTSDSGPNSFSSSSTESASHMNNNNSRPSNSSMAKSHRDEFIGRELRLLQVTDTTMGYQNRSKNNVVELEEQFRQERLKHPWFFQVASMNMT